MAKDLVQVKYTSILREFLQDSDESFIFSLEKGKLCLKVTEHVHMHLGTYVEFSNNSGKTLKLEEKLNLDLDNIQFELNILNRYFIEKARKLSNFRKKHTRETTCLGLSSYFEERISIDKSNHNYNFVFMFNIDEPENDKQIRSFLLDVLNFLYLKKER
ncbi:MAG: hypothetical protein ACRC5T_08110 [Cetobacterium sp.]